MTDTSANNKRIAKNTLLLYARMMLLIVVNLYTSRVILSTLGMEDYGIYNVVGGIVTIFGFINTSMTSATQRYITFAIGKGDDKWLNEIFCISLQIHAGIAGIVFLLSETAGLWFLYYKMQIPPDRMTAAFWVLQCSILSSIVMVLSVPYNAAIIAYEKMSAFAYISILEAVLNLTVVYLLVLFSCDKLILYAILIFCVQIIIRLCYGSYCSRHFPQTKYHHTWNKNLFIEMLQFAGWSIFGNLSSAMTTQGLNMLLNVFFGPIVNAAQAVATQVRSVIVKFVSSFQMALNPQLTKTYAQGDIEYMKTLMFKSARFSYYLLFLISLPVLFETDYILNLWLKEVPQDSVVFLRLLICTSLIYALANPLIQVNQATGKVKKYQAVCGGLLLMILPISYLLLKLGFPAYSVFIVHFFIEIITQLARMLILRPLVGIKIREYMVHIYKQVSIVTGVALILPLFLYLNMEESVSRFLIVCSGCVISVIVASFYFGLQKSEQAFVLSKIKQIVHKTKSSKS